MSNYSATVVKLGAIRPHSNASKLACTAIYGNNIIVGIDAKEGDLGLFFPLESQIGLDFAQLNDLIRRKDSEGKPVGGMFDQTRRVRCQTLRGEKSMGFWIPINSLAKLLNQSEEEVLKNYPVGTEIDTIAGMVISQKYIPKSNKNEMSGAKQPKQVKKSESRVIDNQFNFMFDTSHLGKNLHRFNPDSLIAITWKVHGCFPYHQRIMMWDGTKKRIKDIVVGDIVVGWKDNKPCQSTVRNVFNNGKTNKWLSVKHSAGDRVFSSKDRVVTCTENHHFLTDRGYVPAIDLKENDDLIYISYKNEASNTQKEVLMGLYLGDGSISRHSGLLSFSHKSDHEEYLDYLIKLLGDLSTGTKDYRISGYGTNMIRSTTKVCNFIKHYLETYQIDGGKSLHNSMVDFISPLSLAIWYMDDGSLNKANPTLRADFAICRYKGKDNTIIQNIFDKFGVKVYIREHDGYSRLTTAAEDSDKFFKLIHTFIPEAMQYKLPEKYRGKFTMPQIENSSMVAFNEKVRVISVEESYRAGGNKYDLETSTNNYVAGDVVVHNSSFVTSNCLVKKALPWYEKILQKFGVNIVDTEHDYIYSSRKVIKNAAINPSVGQGFYSEDLWTRVGEGFKEKLHKGESIYGEICGYLSDNSYIQKGYDYGCSPGQHKVYVYRITQTNIDGVVTELSWPQVKERCKEIGVEHVPEIYYGTAGELVNKWSSLNEEMEWGDVFFNCLKSNYVYDQNCHLCKNKVPAEGIIARLEGLNIENYKLKSYAFLNHETKQLDKGEEDVETTQS